MDKKKEEDYPIEVDDPEWDEEWAMEFATRILKELELYESNTQSTQTNQQ